MSHFKNLISIFDLSREQILEILSVAARLKKQHRENIHSSPLTGKTLAMIFEKASLRTRLSFETAMAQQGGHAINLSRDDIDLGKRESIADVARTLSRMVDGLLVRAFSHETIIELAKHADIPVINGLTDLCHPCQVLADCLTIKEKLNCDLEGIKIAFLGDGNNVAHSWIFAATKLKMNFLIASPKSYMPHPDIFEQAFVEAESVIGWTLEITKALSNADIVYTDVWTSGQKEAEVRLEEFKPYQLNQSALKMAKPNALVMHCLPARRGEEITDEVMDGPQSIVFDQAENRLHVAKAILMLLFGSQD